MKELKVDYFDMLSGFPVYLYGVGHIKSPLLKDICPTVGVGRNVYNIYLNFLSGEREWIIKYLELLRFKNTEKLMTDRLSVFQLITIFAPLQEAYCETLGFFMTEDVSWDAKQKAFKITPAESQEKDDSQFPVGTINASNFDDVRETILQFNYIGLNEEDEQPVTHSSQASKEAWEKVQKYLAEQKKHEADKREFHLSNIISKVCAVHPSYNLLNIYNLTIFQLYDAFFQIGYMRSSDLRESIFSNHGGEDFKFEDWLSPIIKKL